MLKALTIIRIRVHNDSHDSLCMQSGFRPAHPRRGNGRRDVVTGHQPRARRGDLLRQVRARGESRPIGVVGPVRVGSPLRRFGRPWLFLLAPH